VLPMYPACTVDDHPSYYMVKSNTKPEMVLEHIKDVIEE